MNNARGYADILAVRLSDELIAAGEAWLAATPGGLPADPEHYVALVLHALGFAADEQAQINGQHHRCPAGAYEQACFGRKHAFARLYESGLLAELQQAHPPAAFASELARVAGSAPLHLREGGVFEFSPHEFRCLLQHRLAGKLAH